MLSIDRLMKKYDDKVVLSDVSFNIRNGEIVGLIGKNGAGKSTILKSISGLISYNAGSITYDEKSIIEFPSVISDFGILIECSFLDYIDAYDNLRILCPKDKQADIDDMLEKVDLKRVKTKKVRTYSLGMKQRLGLAQAMINANKVLILDEPFIGLDPVGKEIIKKLIVKKAKEDHMAVLFSSHDLDDVAEICDRIVMIKNGKCVYNGEIMSKQKYIIYTDTVSDELGEALKRIKKDIEIQDNKITFFSEDSENSFDQINRLILKFTAIKKIDSSNISLSDMFLE